MKDVTISYPYKLKYNRTSKVWFVVIDGKFHAIWKSGKRYCTGSGDTASTLRNAIIYVLKREGAI